MIQIRVLDMKKKKKHTSPIFTRRAKDLRQNAIGNLGIAFKNVGKHIKILYRFVMTLHY